MAAAQAGAAAAPHGIDLVDKDNAGRTLLGVIEQVPDATGADPDKHLDKLRSRDGEEVDPRLTGHRPCQQRLSGAWRTDQQYPLRHLAPDVMKLPRLLQAI